MGSVTKSLAAMGMEQLLLTMFFLAAYACALSDTAGRRRRIAVATALLSAVGCIAFSPSVEAGAILVALAVLGMGTFTGFAWLLWTLTAAPDRPSLRMGADVAHGNPQRRLRAASTRLLRGQRAS
jgi:MFS family permease